MMSDTDLCGGCHNGGTCEVEGTDGNVRTQCVCQGTWTGEQCESMIINSLVS